MAQTLTSFYFHLIFSTKNRVELIRQDIESELFAYIGGILNNHDSKLLSAGGTANHIHLLLSLNKNLKFPDLVGAIKRNSSKWIKTKGGMLSKFDWQDGYSAFTVGHSQLAAVKSYIANQKTHHATVLFEDEMREIYGRSEMSFDEEFVFG